MFIRKMSVFLSFFALIVVSFSSLAAATKSRPSWKVWLAQLRTEAIEKGIRPETFDKAFKGIHAPSRSVLSYDRNQPEKRLTFLKYRNTRADNYRIVVGRREIRRYKPLLSEVSHQYGVSTCFIVSLWGLETSYGRFMGKFPVVKSLATLAYDTRRSAFFRKQLFYALRIINDGHVDPKKFKGEWAGASGHPQFLPSSWYHYSVDHDGDGKRDIWTNHADVFASIANYLVKNGWQKGQPWAINVRAPRNVADLANSKQVKTVSEWQSLGLTTLKRGPWPQDGSLQAELVRPHGGPDMLIFNNFKVLMKWNRSIYYAGTVGYMAEKICNRPLM